MIIPEHTPAYKITHYKFSFHIPALHFYSSQYQEEFGVLSTGDKEMDRALMSTPVGSRDTILNMARKYDENVDITLDDPKDAVRIYEIIQAHLSSWNEAARTEHNLSNIPMDDLRILDEFAKSIYEIARRYKPDVGKTPKFFDRTKNFGGPLSRQPEREVKSEKKPTKPNEHHPVFASIEEHLERRNIKWT